MGITGRYDFKGIKEKGAKGIEAVIAATTWGASLIKIPFFGLIEDAFLQLAVNWLANRGLVVFNLADIVIDGELDQNTFDAVFDDGLRRLQVGRDKLTPAQGKAIDDAVRKAARKFIKFNP